MIGSVRSEDAAAADPSSTASARVTAARHATAVAFVGAGVVFASWVSRIPQVRSELQLTAADLGVVLLALAVGSLLALPAVAVLIRRFGTRVVVSAMTLVTAGALTMIGVGYHAGTGPVVLGLFLMGFGLAASNVGMNVQAAAVERSAGRAIMSRFHAGYSIATVGSALLGAGLIAIGVPVTAHLTIVAVLAAVAVPVAARAFLPDRTDPAAEPAGQPPGSRPRRRRDRRTLLIGMVVLAFAFAEGAGNDWIAVTLVDDHHTSAAVATLGYAAFLTTMTLGRWTGSRLLDRYGRVATIRGLAVLALIGLLLFVLSPWPGLAFAGVLLWGLGACLGYPVGLSAAADDPRHAAHRVSMVSGIGQLAFLAGPPLIGLLASLGTIQHALIVVPVLVALAVLATRALAPARTDHRLLASA
jgi:predicted MFS family arabinose efflux permease